MLRLSKLVKFWEGGFVTYIRCHRVSYKRTTPGYDDPDEITEQCFVRVRKWYFITIEQEELFKEVIPIWAQIQNACLGSTDWRSDAPEWMIDGANNYYKQLKRK